MSLEGLDDIDWAGLTHAYGSAADVPAQLRAVATGSKTEREKAWYDLYGNIWHQGTVYEATAHAVPFFVRLANDQTRDDLGEILEYLSELADGASYLDVHQHTSLWSEEQRQTQKHKEQLAKELDWVSRTRSAVRAGQEAYARLRVHPDESVQEAAAALMAVIDDE
ncbi:MAG: hypothetical protein AAFN27_24390 [Pseudomonadota bacterium]